MLIVEIPTPTQDEAVNGDVSAGPELARRLRIVADALERDVQIVPHDGAIHSTWITETHPVPSAGAGVKYQLVKP